MWTVIEHPGGDHTYIASDELVAWWDSRDCCPDCDVIAEPSSTTDGRHSYVCCCGATWTRTV